MKLTEKWQDRLPVITDDWHLRARRAEAELSATRLTAGAGRIMWELRLSQLEERIEELEERNREIETSTSWRITYPLRRLFGFFKGKPAGPPPRQLPEGESLARPLPASAAPSHALPSSASTSRTSSRENVGLPR